MIQNYRRKTVSAIALLSLIFGTSIARAESDLKDKITELVEASKRTGPACEKYGKAVHALRHGTESGKPLKDKAKALELLALAKTYPGRSADEKGVFAAISQEYYTKGEIDEAVGKVAMEVSGCNIIAIFDAFRTLIVSARPLAFSVKERKEVAQALYQRIASDVDRHNTMFQIFVYGDLLAQLIDSEVVEVSDAIYVELLRWNEKAGEAKVLVRRAAMKNPHTMIGPELELMAPLGVTLSSLTKRLARAK